MNLVSKLKNKLAIRFRRYILREPFLIEVERWFKDKGDETLRLDYPLTSDSVVFDVGGYRGDFAFDINKKYDCTVYIFEPVLEFYQSCVARFANNEKVICFNHGLASVEGQLEIGLADNASSFNSPYANDKKEIVQLRSIVDFIRELSIEKIDLLKVNIEGGEFDIEIIGPREDIRYETLKLSKGSIVIFPSDKWHRVRPVTSGERKSLVTWFRGPPFR